jgi:rhodanese-related sulfurtransferase
LFLDKETYKKIHISVQELKEKIDKGEDFILLDVREPQEYEFSRIKEKEAMLIPLMKLPSIIDKLPKDKPIYVLCRSGNRSLQATLWLLEHGFKNVKKASCPNFIANIFALAPLWLAMLWSAPFSTRIFPNSGFESMIASMRGVQPTASTKSMFAPLSMR